MMKRYLVPVTAILAFLLLSVSSCTTSQPFSNSGAPKLQFNGDSITQQAITDINAHYGSTYDVGIYAVGAADTRFMASAIAAEAALAPKIQIINLGGADVVQAEAGTLALADIYGRFDTFATEFPASTCLIFVNLNTHALAAASQAINDHMSSNPTLFPRIVDWNGAWQASYFDSPTDAHPNETGRQEMIALEDAAIATCP